MATRRIRTDGFVEPCIPTLAAKPPSGPGWVHEIKHDGYRLIVRRDGKAVRLAASASPTFGRRMDCVGAAHVSAGFAAIAWYAIPWLTGHAVCRRRHLRG
jgi:hypothetical protein